MGFNNFLREYFTFNRRERNGVFVLLVIILVLVMYLSSYGLFSEKTETDFSQFEKEIASFEAEQKRMGDSVAAHRRSFYFSGNVPVEDNGREGKENDLHSEVQEFRKKSVVVELNSADTLELQRIKGIGSVFAKRIVKFREALGGFVHINQLLEVYGLDRDKFAQIAPQVRLDFLGVKKLNVNSASVEDMNWHPYLSKKEAVSIFTKRVKTGDFTDLEEVKKITLMSDSAFAKIAPYLTLK